ncbi:MAG: putative RNA-binding protein 8A [Streblomastix strix]|uniref:Putative RNA-binding protein 8A n=1 Tax=Streblomastix strix TaxID=222440 RepID=A0A5J4WVG8_9EUKA|nr:MAG: putative RNA-binding protein 8A [Streblomastix strix]
MLVDFEDGSTGPQRFDRIQGSGILGAPQRSVEGYIIFAGRIHEEAQEDQVKDFFSEFGKVQNINTNIDRKTGYLKGYALIEYATLEEAQRAITEGNGKELLERAITVDFAFRSGPDTPVHESSQYGMRTVQDQSTAVKRKDKEGDDVEDETGKKEFPTED